MIPFSAEWLIFSSSELNDSTQEFSHGLVFNSMTQWDNSVNVELSTRVRGLQLLWDSFRRDRNIVYSWLSYIQRIQSVGGCVSNPEIKGVWFCVCVRMLSDWRSEVMPGWILAITYHRGTVDGKRAGLQYVQSYEIGLLLLNLNGVLWGSQGFLEMAVNESTLHRWSPFLFC